MIYKICYYQNGKPNTYVFTAKTPQDANDKWDEFKEIEQTYRGKIRVYWKGLLDDWTELQKKFFYP